MKESTSLRTTPFSSHCESSSVYEPFKGTFHPSCIVSVTSQSERKQSKYFSARRQLQLSKGINSADPTHLHAQRVNQSSKNTRKLLIRTERDMNFTDQMRNKVQALDLFNKFHNSPIDLNLQTSLRMNKPRKQHERKTFPKITVCFQPIHFTIRRTNFPKPKGQPEPRGNSIAQRDPPRHAPPRLALSKNRP